MTRAPRRNRAPGPASRRRIAARVLIGAGGLACAASALLPALLGGLILLLDLAAEAFLGMSGLWFELAGGGAGAGSGLGAYHGIDRNRLALAAAAALVRALPGLGLVALSLRPPRGRLPAVALALLAAAASGGGAALAGPLAALAGGLALPPRAGGTQIM